jgi:hypothetical protein
MLVDLVSLANTKDRNAAPLAGKVIYQIDRLALAILFFEAVDRQNRLEIKAEEEAIGNLDVDGKMTGNRPKFEDPIITIGDSSSLYNEFLVRLTPSPAQIQ